MYPRPISPAVSDAPWVRVKECGTVPTTSTGWPVNFTRRSRNSASAPRLTVSQPPELVDEHTPSHEGGEVRLGEGRVVVDAGEEEILGGACMTAHVREL